MFQFLKLRETLLISHVPAGLMSSLTPFSLVHLVCQEHMVSLLSPIHVHVCQQCIVRTWGLGLGLGFGLENKEKSKKDQSYYYQSWTSLIVSIYQAN